MKSKLFFITIFAMVLLMLGGCIDDSFSTSPSDQPTFSTDTLKMGTVYTDEVTATHRFVVYNRNSKGISIDRIGLVGANADLFRLNVDGMAGREFSNVEIRGGDSIYVFVEATLPSRSKVPTFETEVMFLTSGVERSVVVTADGLDVTRLYGRTVFGKQKFTADKIYRVMDSLIVEEGAVLKIEPGTKIMFHDKATMTVYGQLIAEGTAEKPIVMTGDRVGDVIPNVSFELMSRQWGGINFYSVDEQRLTHVEVRNTEYGIFAQETPLTLINCWLHNSGENILTVLGGEVTALGCIFSEASLSLTEFYGGKHRFDRCTMSNNYLFSAVSGGAWVLRHIPGSEIEEIADIPLTELTVTNSVTYGYGVDVSPGDFTGCEVYFRRCSFKAAGTDDDNFVDCLWETDPIFYTVRNDYLFDYRLKPDSPVAESLYSDLSDPRLPATDFYGNARGMELGALAVFEAEEDTHEN